MGQRIDVHNLSKVMGKLEYVTRKHKDILENVYEHVRSIGEAVREDYEAKLADVVQQYDEQIHEMQYRIDGYEAENRRVAELLQLPVRFRRAPDMRGELGGPWGIGTVNAVLSIIKQGETCEWELFSESD